MNILQRIQYCINDPLPPPGKVFWPRPANWDAALNPRHLEEDKTLNTIKYLPIIAFTALLGACAGPAQLDLDTTAVRGVPQLGSDFQKALSHDYVALAQVELDESDRPNTSLFDTKARQAAAGMNVMPTRMDQRSITAVKVAELTKARAQLMHVIESGGPSRAPMQTARAQTQFDCWMEEQEENYSWQHADLLKCRTGFLAAINEANKIVFAAAEPAPAPKKVAAPITPSPVLDIASYTIYFDHNSSDLNAAAVAMNNEISRRIKATHATSVTVNGYTDRSGDVEYNRLLAQRRAATVSTALEDSGIKPMVGSESFGENRSAVQTADDVREWHNRRVVVTLRK